MPPFLIQAVQYERQPAAIILSINRCPLNGRYR